MNTLSFGVQIAGAPQAKNELREIIDLQAKLNRNNPLSGVAPNYIRRSPELMAELRQLTGAKLKIPPIIPPPVIQPPKIQPQGGMNFMQIGAGALLSRFHPFMAARELSAGFGQPFGKGPVGAGIFLAGLTVAAVALTAAFHGLRAAVEEGSKLYQHAARLGTTTARAFQIEALGKTLGLAPGELDTLALRGSHLQRGGRQAAFQQKDLQMLLAGGGAGQIGGLQQIKNMGDYASRTFRDLAGATEQMSRNARSMQEASYMGAVLSLEFKSVLVQLATLFMPLIKQYADDAFLVLSAAHTILAGILKMTDKVGWTKDASKEDKDKDKHPAKLAASRGSLSPVGPWEKMGFVIGGFGKDAAQKTAENTTEMVRSLKSIEKKLDHGTKPGTDPEANHTFYHKLRPEP
jgi:hypothetical protein